MGRQEERRRRLSSCLPMASAGRTIPITAVGSAFVQSVDAVKGRQGSQGVEGGQPLRGVGIQERTLRGGRIVDENGGVPVLMGAVERKGGVNKIRSEALSAGDTLNAA